jgi:peptide/nickel transport system permease protein/oligopeptide transport system permease protein
MSEEAANPMSSESPGRRAWRRFGRNRPAVAGAWFLALMTTLVLAWPVALRIAPWTGESGKAYALAHDPERVSERQFEAPGARHWFGTDVHGRDLLSRVLHGARISLLAGLTGTAVSLVIGVSWGAVAGYFGGRVDGFLMRSVDVLYAMPSIILVIVLITTLEAGLKTALTALGWETLARSARLLFLFAGLGVVSWLNMARIVRGQVLSLRRQPFIEASRALGAGSVRILLRHIIPNTWGVIIVYLTLTIPAVMLYESFLSYLGLGIQPPMASWGSLIAEGADQINPIRIYWWLIVFPGGFLVTTLLALSFVGDGLRDAWDVRGE